ncbi:hypothetical protein [Pontibacillus sp. HMF3514]|uniref:hypothetical protein n=1 Tax=Pontibacillus sp. HMF3514 TaxID=2692425 RepID=UPI00131F84B6|nr:hypothetical protein [Pontibacillus sp. HMF3514]QHE51824.1 hypothetical protein GS400_07160 [Pontibacillus sp. HMF3514]
MKVKYLILISTLFMLLIAVFACSKDDSSDFYTSIKMEELIENKSYEEFENMLSDRAAEKLSKEDFGRFHKVLSKKKEYYPTTTFSKYEMISFDNEITFLISIGEVDGETKVTDVKIVSEEMANKIGELFNIK